ncbi:MAG: hypothetical protein P1P69_01655 [Methanosarcinaceae archaeon]|nr:hypothetical protein [Methanosarcinaceae archaeon]MDF1533193.1 hypothetical protein [Methanosarcinaceae archaeon]
MMSRVGVELVVLSIGKNMGIIGDEVFSATVLMVVVSIVVPPILLKIAIMSKGNGKDKDHLGKYI